MLYGTFSGIILFGKEEAMERSREPVMPLAILATFLGFLIAVGAPKFWPELAGAVHWRTWAVLSLLLGFTAVTALWAFDHRKP